MFYFFLFAHFGLFLEKKECIQFLYVTISSNNIVVYRSDYFSILFHVLQENGYQLLFLSARAISQAYHTRRFLFNIKQVMLKEIKA